MARNDEANSGMGTGDSVAIRCSGLQKTYPGRPPVEAVCGLDLMVGVGECFGLLGPNGAGKTTTLEILEGLLEPTGGTVEILGRTWRSDGPSLRERIGISLQETQLSDKLTVRETLTLFRSFYRGGIEPDEAVRRVGLDEKLNARIATLSGGQKQRLAVACALVGDPELLFLDEPTTGLDPQSRRQLWDIIRDFRARGRTVLVTTHYMDEAERLCDRVAVVDRGRAIAEGTPRDLIARLGGDHVIDFQLEEGGDLQFPELQALAGVRSVRKEDGHTILSVGEIHVTLPALLGLLRERGQPLSDLSTRHANLEDVFVSLTGRHLRDEGVAA